MAQVILYQVINIDREEMFFGTCSTELEKEMERLSKLGANGPMKEWKKGDILQWRPLTEKIDENVAKTLHAEIQKKTPPNKYRVIQT
ncbi:MAG: hypothetical protein HYV07_31175 [Deltaproteobacteria bacterium]|nr:hypothetical protein [Deltaproteobacteria bacterium]